LKQLWALAAAGVLCACAAGAAEVCVTGDGEWIARACYANTDPGDVYGHDVLGGTPEWSALQVFHGPKSARAVATFRLARGIFEDVAPRIVDLNGDGRPELVVVHSDPDKGARLVAIGILPDLEILAATRFIGQRNRWLAPAGFGDFDGDGQIEIAYVDRPHLARELVFIRLDGDRLREIGRVGGFSNHQIGDRAITSAVRNCGHGDEVVLPSADWTRLMTVRQGAQADLGPFSRQALKSAAACKP
jgi:hypothetical protein